MPSSTFLNLPAEKQEKLLEAATREFSHRPFNEASINQIIKEAGIPRGSFYMYFKNKEDIFLCLLGFASIGDLVLGVGAAMLCFTMLRPAKHSV